MRPLQGALARAGYDTLNLHYPSRERRIEDLAEAIAPAVARFAATAGGGVHFVVHSMGGLVARALIARQRPDHLGRVVMLGTPSQGSEVADALREWWLYRRLYGPAGQQLVTQRFGSARPPLPAVDYQVGIIAGRWTVDPISSLILPRPNDGKVSVSATRLDGMTDHIVLPVAHPFMPSDRRVIMQTRAFLATGRFAPAGA